VSALDPGLSGAVSIRLPACPFGGSYPFGILASPDGSRVLVTTLGCGDVHLLDSDPASPQFNTVTSSFNLPGGHGRPSWVAGPLALVPRSTFDPNFVYGEAAFAVVDVTAPGGAQSYPLLSTPPPGLYDTATDSAILPSGLGLVTVGFGQGGYLLEVDPSSGVVTRSLAFGATSGDKLHGLGVDPDGRIAAVTFFSVASDVVFVDLASFSILGTVSIGGDTQPNEVVFTRDGSRCLVTLQKSNGVAVLGDLPGYVLELETTSVVPPGGTWEMSLRHIEHGQPAALFVSLAGGGPQLIGGETVHLSDPFWLLGEFVGDPDGGAMAQIPITAATAAALGGATLHFQAATVDRSGAIRLSGADQTFIP
jgi:DNA-binding beta-propeller fold protein YncE